MDRPANGHRLRELASFAVCLAASVLLLGRLLPRDVNDLLEDKLAHLARHRGEYDTLFLGSSVVYRAYDPAVFDATTRAEGLPTRTYNLGIQGLHVVDLVHVAERLERLELDGLRHVIVHAGELIGGFDLELPLTNKSVAWHDGASTLAALELLATSELPLGEHALAIYRHLLAASYRALNVGRGTGPLAHLLGLREGPEARREQLGEAGLGYWPPDADHSASNLRQRAEFLDILDQHRRRLAAYRPPTAADSRLGPRAQATILRLDAALRALGAQPIYVLGLHLVDGPGLVDACAAGVVGPALRYDDPRNYPELYLPLHHFDRAHLNREGGRIFSELLARDFVRLVRAAEAEPGAAR
jgi:hypothetical protein